MNDAVFIADLHLHPQALNSLRYFAQWLTWAAENTKVVYILGDFFHAWAGDDTLDAWSGGIADQLRGLVNSGITVYFMPGNRDFLLGEQFAQRAGVQLLTEPTIKQFGQQRVLLTHGDGYCLDDKAHQRFRRITRAPFFKRVFLALPRRLRQRVVMRIRQHSQTRANNVLPQNNPIQLSTLARDAQQRAVDVIIHGHTHRPEITTHCVNGHTFQHIVLSDWDAAPPILCYNSTYSFHFIQKVNEE